VGPKDEAALAPFMAADCGCGGGPDCDEPARGCCGENETGSGEHDEECPERPAKRA